MSAGNDKADRSTGVIRVAGGKACKPAVDRLFAMGRPPENRREALSKLLWIGIWLVFLSDPVHDLLYGSHTSVGTFWDWTGLICFVALYLVLVFRHTSRALEHYAVGTVLATLFALATTLSLTIGSPWLVLYVYVAVACGATLPLRLARVAIVGVAAVMVGIGSWPVHGPRHGLDISLLIPALLGGFAMTGVRQLVLTTVELRRARAAVAQLAANEERLRLARDLHDLLGHSLSLITLKSELAGRMLPGEPAKAAQQVQDIEQVSRQALVDVREAVTGYRRPRLIGELAGAQVALSAAGITPVCRAVRTATSRSSTTSPRSSESALAWALREAVTNVVRHSGSPPLRDRTGPPPDPRRPAPGAGRRRRRLGRLGAPRATASPVSPNASEKVGGTLVASRYAGDGFRLVARVPLGPSPAQEHPVGSGA